MPQLMSHQVRIPASAVLYKLLSLLVQRNHDFRHQHTYMLSSMILVPQHKRGRQPNQITGLASLQTQKRWSLLIWR